MRKKIVALSMAVLMLAVCVIGGTLAYFTDTKEATNTFTVGNVKIQLIEQQTSENGLVEFKQNKALVPGTSSKNAVSKIVTVKNTGVNDAWVWVELRIPTALLDNPTIGKYDESKNALHYNSYGYFNSEYYPNYAASPIADGVLDAQGSPVTENSVAVADGLWNDFVVVGFEDDGATTVLRSSMVKTLPSGKVSLPALRQVYMDWRIDVDDNGDFILPNGTKYSKDGSWKIKVNAYAIQAEGFANVDEAIAAYNA